VKNIISASLLTFVFLFMAQKNVFAYITVLGEGDVSICYKSAKSGQGGISAINSCLSAINEVGITKKNLYATYVNLGIIYNNSKRPDQAIKVLNKALEYDKTIAESLLSLGNSFYIKKNYEEAIKLYDQSLNRGLKDISAIYFNKGLVYERLNDIKLAVNFYQKAIEIKPEYYDYFQKRARLQRTGEWDN